MQKLVVLVPKCTFKMQVAKPGGEVPASTFSLRKGRRNPISIAVPRPPAVDQPPHAKGVPFGLPIVAKGMECHLAALSDIRKAALELN